MGSRVLHTSAPNLGLLPPLPEGPDILHQNVFSLKMLEFCIYIQGISSQTVDKNLALREERTDISDILRLLFSRKFWSILIGI